MKNFKGGYWTSPLTVLSSAAELFEFTDGTPRQVFEGVFTGTRANGGFQMPVGTVAAIPVHSGATEAAGISMEIPDAYGLLSEIMLNRSSACGHDSLGLLMARADGGEFHYSGSAYGDSIRGGYGRDLIEGNTGNDTLKGGPGFDRLDGGAGNDLLLGGLGNDTLDGGAGREVLRGGYGDDSLLAADGGADRLYGGVGNDTLDASEGDCLLDGKGGFDSAVIGAAGTLTIDLSASGRLEFGTDLAVRLVDIEGIKLEKASGTISGTEGDDLLAGGAGDDTLIGGGGRRADAVEARPGPGAGRRRCLHFHRDAIRRARLRRGRHP
ncbi:calcium-binding protein [Mangrovicoccus sp. HB161399]|uniref:calcium-binding protein n=1 Tax=Mangrovicoccus sp. HB161399 TaxID=2720392 RepID=UPI0015551FC9|nr:calcium-binding protein [Mangrovicoccus sp. HB161399]